MKLRGFRLRGGRVVECSAGGDDLSLCSSIADWPGLVSGSSIYIRAIVASDVEPNRLVGRGLDGKFAYATLVWAGGSWAGMIGVTQEAAKAGELCKIMVSGFPRVEVR